MSKVKSKKTKVKKIAVNVFLLFTFYCLFFNSSAQSVSASLDRDKILLGEQVKLQLSLSKVNEGLSFVATWPQIKDTINHTEIVKRNAIDTINVSGYYTYQQDFTVTSFDSGRWQIGPFTFVVQNKTTGKQITLTTAPLYLTVLPVDVSSLQEYHPIKDIIDVDIAFNWMPVMIAIGLLILAIIIFIIIKKTKKKSVRKPKAGSKETPLQRALKKLYMLEKEELTSNLDIKKFHSETDIIIRQYFEDVMRVKALQLTTAELFSRMNVFMQDAQLRSKFQQLFELNASVKFAKYLPEPDESKSTLNGIIQVLHQIDDTINQSRNNADRMV